MSRHITDELPGVSTPILSAAVLARIHELNLDYMELLAAERNAVDACDGQLQHLPSKLHAAIAEMSPAARASLAALPYTLYSLGFEDEKLWRALAQPATLAAAMSMRERYTQPRDASLQASLCEVALMYAWHVATSSPLAARLIYAMPEAVAERLMAAPPWYVRRLAVHHASLLLPRWPTNPGFWPDLVRFAVADDQQRLATAKVLGSQLIAAELQGSAVQSPRLRARYRG
ncbi:MAG TPA: hypothetical protein VL494_06480 [Steroidobacteraceae bacterium]|jgi:hypothetical protein|nr:hypothetical protein [Steroidobacteraceae bacterium]